MRRLNPGEEMIVDTNTVVGFENTVGFDVRNVKKNYGGVVNIAN